MKCIQENIVQLMKEVSKRHSNLAVLRKSEINWTDLKVAGLLSWKEEQIIFIINT